MWNYLLPNEFYVYICRNENFLLLNKLTLKFQNANEIINKFILEDANNFLLLKECFKKNAILFQYVYSPLSPKYFCRIDDYGVKSKLVFEVAHAGYQNQQENLRFVQLQKTPALTVNVKQKPIEEEIVNDTTATVVIESSKLPKQKKRKVVTEKILLKKSTMKKM